MGFNTLLNGVSNKVLSLKPWLVLGIKQMNI
jgi:hypothetical protein